MKALLATSAVVLLLIAPLAAVGPTIRIEIRDIASGAVSQLTDPNVLNQFNVWSGPGTYSGSTEGTEGFIIDWRSGPITEWPVQLHRYELRFYNGPREGKMPPDPPERLAYVVIYEHDAATGRGYVYLPGKTDENFGLNVRSIVRHGLEGHWFNANDAWQTAFSQAAARR
jgi:hypothetical protein